MIATLFQSLNINIDEPQRDDQQSEKLMQPVLFVMRNMMHIFTMIGKLWTNEPIVIEVSLSVNLLIHRLIFLFPVFPVPV